MSLATLNSSASMSMSELRRTVQMRERIVEACRLVESRRTVRGVHIVAKEPPTSDELRRYQDYAAMCHVSMAVDSHGMISIRPDTGESE